MNPIVTRCPNCQVAFRASEAQLQAANGLVRCGACLTIFNARDNISSVPSAMASTEHAAEEDWAGEHVLIGDETAPPVEPTPEAYFSFSPEPAPQDGPLIDKPPLTKASPNRQLPEHSDRTSAPQKQDIVPVAENPDNQHAPLADAESRDSGEECAEMPPPPVAEHGPDDFDPTPSAETLAEVAEQPVIPFDKPPSPPPVYQPVFSSAEELEERYFREPDPSPQTGTRWFMNTLAATLLIGLMLQVAYFYSDRLSTSPELRPWMESFCSISGCPLAESGDDNLIKSTEVLVHSHPTLANALLVDAVILNDAPFDQPFPDLVLEFENLQGQVVARRRFAREEYLLGELAGAVYMPSGQPVHLQLEIVDPGESAVSYNLYIPD